MAPFSGPLTPPLTDHSHNGTENQAITGASLCKTIGDDKSATLVQGPSSPLPAVGDLDSKAYPSEEALLADIVESMQRSGGCVVRNLVSTVALGEIEREVRPWLQKAQPWNGKHQAFILFFLEIY